MRLHCRPLLTACCLWLAASAVLAQGRTAAQTRRAEPPGACLVSEFRAMGLGTHDLTERAQKARQWLARNLAACGEDQLRLLSSNRTLWLGHADSLEFMGMIDGALESRLKDKPEQLARLFGATAAPARPPGDDTLRSGALAPRPAPVVPPAAPAAVTLAAPPVVLPAAGLPGAPPPGAMPGALPPGAVPPGGALAPRPPELGRHFDEKLRTAVREFFTANRGSGPCPAGLVLKNARCESAQSERPWKPGQSLPAQLTARDVPAALLEKLGPPPPGHSYVQVEGDLLLLNTATRVVVDAVLDLGQVPPKA